jgi:hypothetical protein
MRPRGRGRAIADPPRLDHIVEWQVVGDALRLDPDGSRGYQRHLALAKAARNARISNDGCRSGIADDNSRALAAAMFELRKECRIGEA